MTPLDGPVRWFILAALVVCLAVVVVLEVRDARRRGDGQAAYRARLGIVDMPRRSRRSRGRWSRW